MSGQTFYQVAPRYTAGSPAQVDEAQAQRVAAQEVAAFRDHRQEGRIDAGLGGIVESVTDVGDRRVIVDLITGKRTEARIGRSPIQDIQDHLAKLADFEAGGAADALKADLRILQDLANRRGGTWLIKWAMLFRGIRPGQPDINLDGADPAYRAYAEAWPYGPDPRD